MQSHGQLTYVYDTNSSDHRVLDFPGFEPAEWERQQALARDARRSFAGKVIALYTSLFFELAMGHPDRKSKSS